MRRRRTGAASTASTSFEVDRIAEAGIEAHPWEEFGYDDLIGKGMPPRRDRLAAHQPERLPRVRDRGGDRAPLLPGTRRRSPARKRDHTPAGLHLLRRPPPREDRGRDRGHPPRPEGRRGRNGRSEGHACARRALERQPVGRRPAADQRADQGRDSPGLHRPRHVQRRLHRLARAADGERPRPRFRPDRA